MTGGGTLAGMHEEDQGPHDARTFGVCADGHPLNRYGRCQPLAAQEGPDDDPADQTRTDPADRVG